LTLVLDGPDGSSSRTLHGRSCASVSDAAAFVTAVVVDPSVVDRARPIGSAERPDTPAADDGADAPSGADDPASEAIVPAAPLPPEGSTDPLAPAPSSASSPGASSTAAALPAGEPTDAREPVVAAPLPGATPRAARSTDPRGFVRVAGGLEALGMPGLGGQLQLATGLLGRAWRAELRGAYRLPTRAAAPEQPAAGGRIGLWTVGALGCGVLRPAVLEVPLCAGVEAGQAHGSGFGFPDARQARVSWAALVVAAAVAWAPRRWFALWLGAELGVPLFRGSFGIGGLGVVHRVGAVSPRAALGIELRFP
jgi:hypothetical protein